MKIVRPTNEEPWEWGCIEWETLRVYPNFIQVHDEYKGVTIEIHVTTDGVLEVYDSFDD